MPIEEIDVLLATYNGEKFLREFLESLLRQKNVKINLKASDDGSQDQTLEILHEYSQQFHSFKLLSGPSKGPGENFLFLLKHSTAEFAAFADQDDVWLPEHLSNSIFRLKNKSTPAMTFASVKEFSSSVNELNRIWPTKLNIDNIANIAFENYARGCVIVLNSSAVKLINSKSPKYLIMHDWWILQVLMTCGEISFSSLPEVYYRIHNANFTKRRYPQIFSFIQTLIRGNWKPILQLQSLYECYGSQMDQKNQKQLLKIINISHSRKNGFIYSLTSKERHRTGRVAEIKLRFGLIFTLWLLRNNTW
jgi:glycosyltransferase involved in cell wall biosynthesis